MVCSMSLKMLRKLSKWTAQACFARFNKSLFPIFPRKYKEMKGKKPDRIN